MGNIMELCPCKKEDDYENKTPMEGVITEEDENNIRGPMRADSISSYGLQRGMLAQKRESMVFARYEKIRHLGSGTFGTVDKVKTSTGQIRAMKTISKDSIKEGRERKEIVAEMKVLNLLDHPNIMKIFDFYEDENNFYVICEFCDKGYLGDSENDNDHLMCYPEVMVKYFAKMVFSAVAYMHHFNLMHGDIKEENILISSNSTSNVSSVKELAMRVIRDKTLENELNSGKFTDRSIEFINELAEYSIKLVDFGCVKFFKGASFQKGIIGTSFYNSPEATKNEYCLETDEWAIGVLMYTLLTAKFPFYSDNEEEVFTLIRENKPDYYCNNFTSLSSNCKDLIKRLLTTDPEQRLKAKDALKHPFFTENNYIEDYINKSVDLAARFDIAKITYNMDKDSKNLFKENVIAYITLNCLSKDEEFKIKAAFTRMAGTSKSCSISKEKFIQYMKENTQNFNEEEANAMFEKIDSDKSGKIEYQELLRAMSDRKNLLTEENLKVAFNHFDIDKDGKISVDEMVKQIFLKDKIEDIKPKLLNGFLNQLGITKDQKLSYEDFCKLIKSEEE